MYYTPTEQCLKCHFEGVAIFPTLWGKTDTIDRLIKLSKNLLFSFFIFFGAYAFC